MSEPSSRRARGDLALRVATWNVHSFVGTDGRKDPRRIRTVLRELDADVIGLQEIECQGADVLAAIGALQSEVLLGPACAARAGFGNAVISRLPVLWVRTHDLSVAGFEPRSALEVWLQVGPLRVRTFTTHLGLDARERAWQSERLRRIIDDVTGDDTNDDDSGEHAVPDDPGLEIDAPADATVLLGDFNAADRRERSVTALNERFPASPRLRSFPSFLPVLRLDRVMVEAPGGHSALHVHRSRSARTASDHLPVVASVTWPAALVQPLSTSEADAAGAE